MAAVKGAKGYEANIEKFVEASANLDFASINQDFLRFLPVGNANVLDLGAGIGQNANALAKRGYNVIAVEPLGEFISIARELFPSSSITWVQDSMPALDKLCELTSTFEFILIDGVSHHLDSKERGLVIARFSGLLSDNGYCAISLRNGPAGVGTHVYPTSIVETKKQANTCGLACEVVSENLPSRVKNKNNVYWSRVVLRKTQYL